MPAPYDYGSASGYARTRPDWADFPATTTPIQQTHLDQIDQAIKDIKSLTFNVMDYDATGDGVADDTAEIQAALSAASSGGIVYFPPGVYKVTSALTLPVASKHSIIVKGSGLGVETATGGTRIVYSGAGYCFQFGDGGATDAWTQYLEDLTVDCSSSGAPTGCLKIFSTRFCGAIRCRFVGPTGGSKILVNFDPGSPERTNYFARILGCSFSGATQASDIGIKLLSTAGAGANSNWIEKNWFGGFNQSVLIDGGDSNIVRDNEFNGSTNTAIVVQTAGTTNNLIEDNQFDGPTTAVNIGAGVTQTTMIANRPSTMTVTDNGTGTIRIDQGRFKWGPAVNMEFAASLASLGDNPQIALGTYSGANIGNVAYRTAVAGEANQRFFMRGTGEMNWGAGGASAVDLQISRAAADLLGLAAGDGIQFAEAGTDLAAGAANSARLYARDNGAGKTQLVVRFATGVVQVLATEP